MQETDSIVDSKTVGSFYFNIWDQFKVRIFLCLPQMGNSPWRGIIKSEAEEWKVNLNYSVFSVAVFCSPDNFVEIESKFRSQRCHSYATPSRSPILPMHQYCCLIPTVAAV